MKEKYLEFQREFYEKIENLNDEIVGNYQWHEHFPYETYLLYENGDVRKPIFDNFSDKLALDFGCGPGRMIARMNKVFKRADGADIARNCVEEAKKRNPDSNIYLTSGNNLGDAPADTYDFIYSTISFHHISSYEARKDILLDTKSKLKEGGKITLQMAFINNNDHFKHPTNNAKYFENNTLCKHTNGGQDCVIMPMDVEEVKQDFNTIFNNTKIWYCDITPMKEDLNGIKHNEYWATHWIFIHAHK